MRNRGKVLLAAAVVLIIAMLPFALADTEQDEIAESGTFAEIRKDKQGFRLFVDGAPFEVKGVVWSYTPIGENYAYDLWSQPDEIIQETIDRDAELMKEIGVNAIRVFSMVPPKWIQYLHRKHGIYTIVNYLFARYGITVNGIWYPQTDYSDYYTRELIKKEALEIVNTYKDVPGVLMFLFGNENNYGLEWDSGQIKNLPVGQQMETRASYLYDLFGTVIEQAQDSDPHHPIGLVNGDIQYINLIKQLVPTLDILGVNTYRGEKAYDLFFKSITQLDVPFVFTEFGADAYNAASSQEDQYHQAYYLHNQWEEIYQNSYGKDGYQNALGGFVFEWMDEWWKHGQEDRLDIHDTEGTWTNGGYSFDAGFGKNNMNEEWFGIIAQSREKINGVPIRVPRAAYYMLKHIWELSLYDSEPEEVHQHFSAVEPRDFVGLGDGQSIRSEMNQQPVSTDVFSFLFEGVMQADRDAMEGDWRETAEFRASQEGSFTFGLHPLENLLSQNLFLTCMDIIERGMETGICMETSFTSRRKPGIAIIWKLMVQMRPTV